MKTVALVLALIQAGVAISQTVPDTMNLEALVREALTNNPELKAFELNRDMKDVRVGSVGVIPDPELTFMREEMQGFRWRDAAMQKIELMQMIPFPGKLGKETAIANIQAEHAHHEHMEKANDVLATLRSMYFELWFVQQATALNRKNALLLHQFTAVAQTRYGVGATPQQDVLKAYVEIARLDNQLVTLRQQEQSAKAMLMSLLNRRPSDTLGIAIVPEETSELPSLDTLQILANRFRGMLLHDSLSVEEAGTMTALAQANYLPDFKIGLAYVTMPNQREYSAWTVSAGLTLPILPWSLSRTGSMVEEAQIGVAMAREKLNNSRNMIRANITDLYAKVQSLKQQLANYTSVIVPQTEQTFRASLTAYQTGKTDFLMLIDSYRMLVELSMEKLMIRMQYEQALAQLKREVGYARIFDLVQERTEP